MAAICQDFEVLDSKEMPPILVPLIADLLANMPYDGESKDLFTMKQNEEKWVELENSMEDVITRSGLDKSERKNTNTRHKRTKRDV
ncbi:putative metallophosphoesterase [Quercus suber]|uniref:Metallophosphoesterase n=1 Tax=Quercus suber TaxID=58331 RepID=A0AAW0KNG4_QUESU